MVNKWIIGAVVLVAIALFFFLGESDEDLIKEKFYIFGQLISKDKGEKIVGSLSRFKEIKSLFGESCKVNVGDNFMKGDYNPEKMAKQVLRGRMMFNSLSVKFYDINVTIKSSDANVVMTARATGSTKTGSKLKELREVQSNLKKIDGKWKITSLEESKVLQK